MHHVDLIIVGDFLEWWQPPTPCAGKSAEIGCSVDEITALVALSMFAVGRPIHYRWQCRQCAGPHRRTYADGSKRCTPLAAAGTG
jgi:hypothetical protein